MSYNSELSYKNKIWQFILFVIFVLTFILISICVWLKNSHSPRDFKVLQDNTSDSRTQKPFFQSSLIPQPDYLLAVHSASLEVLPDGSLIAVWFAGSHEGRPDVKIFQSYFKDGRWTLARAILSRDELSKDTHFFVKKLGNPVIYRALDNKLHLFVVSVSVGGWSGSSINHLISTDNGKTWGEAKNLILSPVFNISSLVRISATPLTSGGFYLPIYHESIRTYPELLYFNKAGDFVSQYRFNSQNHLIQPTIVVLSKMDAYVYFRNHNSTHIVLMMQKTNDGGSTWSNAIPTNITNPDSSISAVNLGDGRILMVRNTDSRKHLVLSITRDGVNWKDIASLESTNTDTEFSYPNLQMRGDIIDILYTWERKKIKHVRFNLAWINQQASESKS